MLEIDAVNQHPDAVPLEPLKRAMQRVLSDADVTEGAINIAVIDDAQMHELNRRHLDHDYPTDVLSFVFEHQGGRLDGEVIVSLDTARREAQQWGWAPELELLLYVIHGALHLVGYDDHEDEDRNLMRERERHYFQLLGHPIPPGRDAVGDPSDA